jgi:ribosome-binding protein aMBF1 (putative translation factor)
MREDLGFDLWEFDIARYGVHVVRARHQLGLSRSELSRRVGLSRDKVRRLEYCDGGVRLADAGKVQRMLHCLIAEATARVSGPSQDAGPDEHVVRRRQCPV